MSKMLVIANDLFANLKDNEKILLKTIPSSINVCIGSSVNEISIQSIYIGLKIPKTYKYYKMIILMSCTEEPDSNNIFNFNNFTDAIKFSQESFIMFDKKVLLYLGKFPNYGVDIDGGSILARQLIDTLKCRCCLDLVFIRKRKETYKDEKINNIFYVEYLDAFNNKFVRRLENLDTNRAALKNYKNYDYVITAHISKFFGMYDKDATFWNKTILFPMFCTRSYERAGEEVPIEYTHREREVVEKVSKIITPAFEEKKDLIRDYNCTPDKIVVIPRGISRLIHAKKQCGIANSIKLICIGSIKPQKNNIAVIELLRKLREDTDFDYRLHLVYTIQNISLYNSLLHKIKNYNLSSYVVLHEAINQEELAKLLTQMDFNISVSNWETFGRGIFEGVTAGLPTIVFDKLTVVKDICESEKGIFFTKSLEEMESIIIELSQSVKKYQAVQQQLKKIASKVTYYSESQRLAKAILNL